MSSTMVRNFALATLSVCAAVCGSTVEAAPRSSSPFAGKYTGPVPDASAWGDWGSISISTNGGIAFSQPPAGFEWKFSGSVHDDGTFSVSGQYHFPGNGGFFTNVLPALDETSVSGDQSSAGAAAAPAIALTLTSLSTGTVVLGGDGNLHGTTTAGASFVWTRK
jgi:hypothetical protein